MQFLAIFELLHCTKTSRKCPEIGGIRHAPHSRLKVCCAAVAVVARHALNSRSLSPCGHSKGGPKCQPVSAQVCHRAVVPRFRRAIPTQPHQSALSRGSILRSHVGVLGSPIPAKDGEDVLPAGGRASKEARTHDVHAEKSLRAGRRRRARSGRCPAALCPPAAS